jgi:hypothetical protein
VSTKEYYDERWKAFLPEVARILRWAHKTRKAKPDEPCTDYEEHAASSILNAWMVHVSKWEAHK